MRVWGGLAAIVVAGAVTLQMLGPPRAPGMTVAGHHGPRTPAIASKPASVTSRLAATAPVTVVPGTITPPDPALLAAIIDQPARKLPVIAADGRTPASVYAAAPVKVLPNQARLAVLVDGIGLDEALSQSAIAELPAPVSLAFSPYADGIDALATAARARGHEMLISLPMEPEGAPLNDEGDRQLSPDADTATNTRNLLWALSSLQGYVGATGAESGQGGEHVLGDPSMMAELAHALASRGLIFVDPRPGAAPAAGLSEAIATATVDAWSALVDQDAALTALAGDAVRDGEALGIIGPLRPASLARLIAWIRTLPGQGIILVPVSSLAHARAPEVRDAAAAAAADQP